MLRECVHEYNKITFKSCLEIFTQTSQRAFLTHEISFYRRTREPENSKVIFQGIYLAKEHSVEKSCPHFQSGFIHGTYHTAYTEDSIVLYKNCGEFFGCATLIYSNVSVVFL